MKLANVSIDRPVFAAMLILAFVVVGLVSLGRTELRLQPKMEFPYAYIVTELRGASPETVEREVTQVLEEQLNPIEGIQHISSTSSQGRSTINIEFGMEYDPDIKVQEVRDRVALARGLLPRDIEEPIVQKFDLSAFGFMHIVVGGNLGPKELADFAEFELKERLERIPGIGGVSVTGARQREVRIWLDPLRLTGYGLAIDDVSSTLRRENAEFASGRIEGSQTEWAVTTQGKAKSVEEFGEIVVAQRAGRVVRLRDVAVVEDGMAEEKSIARLNGRPGIALELVQQSGSDLVAATRIVREELEAVRANAPAEIEFAIARDYAKIVEEQIKSVLFDMLLATFLVVAVVLAFLRNVRSTWIASLAIPSSVIATFTFLYALDISLNNMTLMALTLAIGLVIDDAIVVLEGIFRHVEAGEDSVTAARRGADDVGLAVISTTLAVCAVFVPVYFMTSTMGRFFYEFAVVVVVAVAVSLLVAFTLTPALASKVLRQTPKEGRIFKALEHGLQWMEREYGRVLGFALRHRGATVALTALVIAGGCGVAGTVPRDYFTEDDLSEAYLAAELPVGTPLAVTDRMLRRVEAAIAEHPYVRGVFAQVGNESQHQPHKASLNLLLIPKNERIEPLEHTFEELRTIAAEVVPEVKKLSVGYAPFASSAGNSTDLRYGLQGPDLVKLEEYADALTARMRADDAFVDVQSTFERGKPQITLDVDRGRAAELGVSATAVGSTLRTLLAGEKVGSFEDRGNRYDVRVQVLPEYRDDPSQIALIRVRSVRGELVPITNTADVRIEDGPVEIRRHDRSRVIDVLANMTPGVSLEDADRKLMQYASEIVEAPAKLVPGGQAESMAEAGADIAMALTLAMIAIYMVLASLFNSLTQPFTIMLSAPLSFIGGFLALKLAGQSMDIMGNMGLLVLMGLVMKNGILVVDYVIQLRAEGVERNEAVLRAGPVRMRPVLMTSGALIFGLLPMALSNATGSEFRAPMAWIVIGGLATSTALTLVVVPVFYTIVDGAGARATAAFWWLANKLRGPRPRTPGSQPGNPVQLRN